MAWTLLLLCFGLPLALAPRAHNNTHEVRIVGGFKTTIDKYPFMTSECFLQVDIHKNERHHCGGTLLTIDVVLTASHCVYKRHLYDSQR
ncbi:Trypsin-4, partial [Gryllus bimaculatus]